MREQVELLSPAGDFETALAAFAAGADAVYCGLQSFSARAFAVNFSWTDLEQIVAYAHANSRKVYVTFNTIVDEDAVGEAIETLARLEEIGPDALIVQDLGIARLCRRHFPGLALHASTQLVAHNLEGVLALRDLGFTRVVLARETSLEEIRSIAKRCGGMELECFIHGALCYSVSGLCLYSAMEKNRSGNRGKCAYCCRLPQTGPDGRTSHPFSMKDLRLGEDVRRLVDAGVVSLKIEGRMKTALYVSSVTAYYRAILDGMAGATTTADLETVFSRRTTKLYFDGPTGDVIDPVSLGHLGARIGTVKRITKDRDRRSWLRFHTSRALEKHDGLQFAAPEGGKPLGFGIGEMRTALSRSTVCEVPAGTDVEILLPDEMLDEAARPALRAGAAVYCSMSNVLKRRFPVPSFRPSDYPAGRPLDIEVELAEDGIRASVAAYGVSVFLPFPLSPARTPGKTPAAVEKAFSKLGGTAYSLGSVTVVCGEHLFAPPQVLNDLRRDLVERLDAVSAARRKEKIAAAQADDAPERPFGSGRAVRRTLKIRVGQNLPQGNWDEIIVGINASTSVGELPNTDVPMRLALPVYTPETAFARLRVAVKNLIRAGYARWEASDLATVRLLRSLGVTDLSADWSLAAFNSHALAVLSGLGVDSFVASPENTRDNLQFLAECGCDVEFLEQQSTPLFVSLTAPAVSEPAGDLCVCRRDGLWVTTKRLPRCFELPGGVSRRIDLSWGCA